MHNNPPRYIMQFPFLITLLLISAVHAFVGIAGPARAGTRLSTSMMEKTYIMVKPDGVQRGVVGKGWIDVSRP